MVTMNNPPSDAEIARSAVNWSIALFTISLMGAAAAYWFSEARTTGEGGYVVVAYILLFGLGSAGTMIVSWLFALSAACRRHKWAIWLLSLETPFLLLALTFIYFLSTS